MESERARNTSFEPSTEGYQTVEFDLALTDTVLTRWVDPTPFIPHNEQLRAERCAGAPPVRGLNEGTSSKEQPTLDGIISMSASPMENSVLPDIENLPN